MKKAPLPRLMYKFKPLKRILNTTPAASQKDIDDMVKKTDLLNGYFYSAALQRIVVVS